MATLRDIVTRWTFHADTSPLERIEKHIESIHGKLEFLAGIEVVKHIIDLTEKFAEYGESLHVASANAGITVEEFQKLSSAARKSAVDQDEMGMAMFRLSRHVYDAKRGVKEAIETFRRAGISSEQLASFRNGKDALLALSDKFAVNKDSMAKQALAQELMGRGSLKMISFLSKGSGAITEMGEKAEKLGKILSGEQVEALVKVQQAFMGLWGLVKAVSATIAAYFAPSITDAINDLVEFYSANKKIIDLNIKRWVWEFAYSLGYLFGAIRTVAQKIADFISSHQELVKWVGEVVGALVLFSIAGWLVKTVLGFLSPAIDAIKLAFKGLGFLLSPGGLLILALLGIGVVIHDLWEIAHGRPGWIQEFMEWAGIADDVNGAFQDFFQFVSDNWSSVYNPLMWIGKALDFLANGLDRVAGYLDSFGGMLDDFGNKIDALADKFNNLVRMANIPIVSKAWLFLAGAKPTNEESQAQFDKLVNRVPDISNGIDLATSTRGASGPPSVAGSSSNQYSVNAPITVNVPRGTDPKMVGDKVAEGVKGHLDQVRRETYRSLRPTQSY